MDAKKIMISYFTIANNIRKKLTINPGKPFVVSDFSSFSKSIGHNISFFYMVLCFLFYSEANKIFNMSLVEPTQMLWPMQILWHSLLAGNGLIFINLSLFASLLAIVFPGFFLLRFICFFSIFSYAAYKASFGSINHGYHFLVFVSFLLLFIPNANYIKKDFTKKQSLHLINIFWLIQFLLLFCYSLSGLWKVIGFNAQLFTSDSLLLKVVQRSLQSDGNYVFWQAIAAQNTVVTQILHVFIVFVQLCSILFFFRPQLIKYYGIILIAFHFGTSFLLTITFHWHVFVWGIFFVLSPFHPKSHSIINILYSLPLFGRVISLLFPSSDLKKVEDYSSQAATIVYDKECPFCSNYVALMKLKTCLGEVQLINARDDHDIINEIKRRNLDLNEGMVFIYKDNFYYGSDAVHMITILSSSDSFFSTLNHFMFSNKVIAKLTYPLYKVGRRVTLKILGKSLIS